MKQRVFGLMIILVMLGGLILPVGVGADVNESPAGSSNYCMDSSCTDSRRSNLAVPPVVDSGTPAFQNLNLTSMCSDDPDTERRWRVTNPNDFDVDVRWEVYGTAQSGILTAVPGYTYFFTQTVPDSPNTTIIYWLDGNGVEQSCTKASGGVQCPPSTYDLIINSTAGGSVIIPGEGVFPCAAGTTVAIAASPNPFHEFVSWSGSISTVADPASFSTAIVMDSDRSITAQFARIPTPTYTLSTSVDPAGSGTITLNPPGGTYDSGTWVGITAVPNAGYEFDHWSGGLSGDVNPGTIIMNSDKSVIAHFAEIMVTPGSIIYVNDDASGANNGTCWTDAFNDLQSALSIATAGQEIWVASGTYMPSVEVGGIGDRYKAFQMKNNVGIYGGFFGTETFRHNRSWESQPTIISGDIGVKGENSDNCYHVFYHPGELGLNNTAILDGFTITGGKTHSLWSGEHQHDDGGGMCNIYASPTVRNCIFTGNVAVRRGGGMLNYYSAPVIENCVFHNNESTTYRGGAMHGIASPAMVINCEFYNNSARDGGAICDASYPRMKIINCSIYGNMATYGGGLLISCTYPEYECETVLTNCILADNTANYGGAIFNKAEGTTPVINNCIIWENSATYGNEIYNDSGAIPVINYSNVKGGYAGSGNIDLDPQFVNPGGGDFHLQPTSPCINAGTNGAQNLPSEDFEGDPRIIDIVVDIGVDEATEIAPTVFNLTTTVDPIGSGTITLNPPGGTYNEGTEVGLIANPVVGYEFDHWSGDLAGDVNPGTITMNSDKVITAHFTEAVVTPGSIIYVFDDADGANNGTCWADAFNDLQDALAAASSGHEIWVASGTYIPQAQPLMPTADFTYVVCGASPLDVQFYDRSIGNITGWSWDFGDGNTSSEQNPLHTYDSPGRYAVDLEVNGELGQDNCTHYYVEIVENLLLNPRADYGSDHWATYGETAIEGIDDNPHFVVRNKGQFHQDVNVNISSGYHVLFMGRTSSERINEDGSITGLPYLYGYLMNDGLIIDYLQGQNMLCDAETENEWVTSWGIYEVPGEVDQIRFFLNQAERAGDPQNGSAASFDDLGLFVFRYEDQALRFVYGCPDVTTDIQFVPEPALPDRLAAFQMKNGVGIYGGFAGTETERGQRDWNIHKTILSGNIGDPDTFEDNCYHVFYNPSNLHLDDTAVLDGFTIRDGYADGAGYPFNHTFRGGGMYNESCSIVVRNCLFRDNRTASNRIAGKVDHAGGMFNSHSSLTVSNCTFENNRSEGFGAGIYEYFSSSTITGCDFISNTSNNGAGISSRRGQPIITDCSFIGNHANISGGGMEMAAGSTAIITNCVFANNTSTYHGGAVWISDADPQMINCTLFQNLAPMGGGVYTHYYAAPTIMNSIIWGNSPSQFYVSSSSGIPVVSYCTVQGGYAGTGNINLDPQFINSGGGDFHLLPTSPCINAGNNVAPNLPSTDFEGDPRIIDGIVDMGADESMAMSGPVAYWPLDEINSGVTPDIMGDHDGMVSGASLVSGVCGNALEFDGINDFVNCRNDSALDVGGSDFTITAWAKPTKLYSWKSAWTNIIGKNEVVYWGLGITTHQIPRYVFHGNGNAADSAHSFDSEVTLNEWVHLAGVYNGDDIYLYVNGELKVTDDAPSGIDHYPFANVRIAGYGNPFEGMIDEVRIYDRAMSDQEVLDLYHQVLP